MEPETLTLPRQPHRQRFKLRFNPLWTIWFCVIVVCVELYLVVQSISDYTVYNSVDIWPGGKPVAAINSILVFAVLSVLCLPMFVVSCVAKVGNLANDEVKLGTEPIKEIWHKRERLSTMARFWRDFGPTAQVIHIVSAFLLLLPRPFIEAELIKAGQFGREITWWSDLSVLFPLTEKQLINATIEWPVASQASFSMEFVNYALAHFMFMIRYAAVFWNTNLPFSCLFSIQLFFLTIQSVISYCAFSVVYKAQVNAELFPNVDFILSGAGTVALYLISSTLVFVQNIAVFEYGYQQYVLSRDRTRSKVWPNYQKPNRLRSDCYGYTPHIVAMSSMLTASIFKVPFLYDGGVIYRWYNDKLILWCIVGEVCYLMFWIILWFFLTLKHTWSFQFNLPSWYQEKSKLFTIRNEAFQESTTDLTVDVVNGAAGRDGATRYDDRPDPSGSTVISNDRILRSEMQDNYQALQPRIPMDPRMDARMDLQPNKQQPVQRDNHAVARQRFDRDYAHVQYHEPPPSDRRQSSDYSSVRRHSQSDYPPVSSTAVVRDPGMVATVNIKITPNTDQPQPPPVPAKPSSRATTPSNSTPTTPVSSRPTTPTRSSKSRHDNLTRSNSCGKKRNRVTFEDCIRNANQYSDSDEPKSDNDSNSSNNSEPKPVGILKKSGPKSPSAKDIAKAIEGIQKAAKDLKHTRQRSLPVMNPSGPGALQPQIRSKVQRRDSKSSDISDSPDRDYSRFGSLPRNYKTRSGTAPLSVVDLTNPRGQPAYSSTGRGILKPRTSGRPGTDRLPLLDTQLDSGVELSDSSSMAYGPASPPIIVNQHRDSANFSMSSQESSPQDITNKDSNLCSQV